MLSREEAVLVARPWNRTPYARGGRAKGPDGGIDCGTLLAEYLIEIGRCSREEMDRLLEELGFLSNDWFCHANEEKYLNALLRFTRRKWDGMCFGRPPALPGDIAMYRVVSSDRFNHGSIVLDWPLALHAFEKRVAITRPTLHPLTSHMPMAIFDPWGKA